MSTSLPRLRTISQSVDDKQNDKVLKFKKLKLGTEDSIASLKSLHAKKNPINGENIQKTSQQKTQRISSMDRYSTIHELHQRKNDRMHLNLLERKLLSGRYDQKDQTGRQLNTLKVRTDQYRVEGHKKHEQAEKIKSQLAQIKKQIENIMKQRKKIEDAVENAQLKYQNQKKKVEFAKSDRTVYQYMISSRQKIQVHLQGQVSVSRAHLEKLIAFQQVYEKQSKETIQRFKNTEHAYQKIKQKIDEEHEVRELQLLEQQNKIERRVEAEVSRDQRIKNFEQIKERVGKQQYQKIFNDSYQRILAEKFLSRFVDFEHDRLISLYQHMEQQYRSICSFSRFSHDNPNKMSERFAEHEPQAKQLRKIIKEKEQAISILESKAKANKEKYNAVVAASLETHTDIAFYLSTKAVAKAQNANYSQKNISQEMFAQLRNKQKVGDIKRWVQQNISVLNIKGEKSLGKQAIARNFLKIIQYVKDQLSRVKELQDFAAKKEQDANNQAISQNKQL